MGLEKRPAKLVIEPDHLIQKFRIFDVIALLIPVVWQRTGYHLLICDVLEVEEVALVLI